jgi:glutamate-1-semialdehyde 2,1-aminomutase
MSAIRLARAATQRDAIVKCIGCYHGHSDGLLVEAGSGALTHGTPSSPGIPRSITSNTLLVQYNDLVGAQKLFEEHGSRMAAFLIEPVAGNMGLVEPAPGYLAGLRQLCDRHGTMLIFDEVMTCFLVAWGGAQVRYHVKPDITCLGKVIGGGLPIGAYGARRELMEMISPAGPVYQAGTLSGNPLAMAGGLATLEILAEPGAYETLEEQSDRLARGLAATAEKTNVPLTINRVGAMLGLYLVKSPGQQVQNFADALSADTAQFAKFFHAMLARGVYLAPSQYEALFVGLAHTDEAIDQTIEAAAAALKMLSSTELSRNR